MIEKYTTNFFKTSFADIPAYTFSMKVKDLLQIHYVASRGIDREEGAVQRVLNKRRIMSIQNYVLEGNIFFNSFIINWTDENYSPEFKGQNISIPLVDASAQVIDGQHRLAGLGEAIKEKEVIGEDEVIVTLCEKLTTAQAAKIFLNINTEQKPVPKSLVYDLFGEVVDNVNHAIVRASDIAKDLNDNPDSPYYKLIKFPGTPRGVGCIELSTFVDTLKPHLSRGGVFYRVNLENYNRQRDVINNFFSAIKEYYMHEKLWNSKMKNPFLKAAGFNGAMDFFTDTLIVKCAENKSFSIKTIKKIIGLDKTNLITWDDLSGMDGKTARKTVKDYLSKNLLASLPDQEEYEF